MSEDKILIAYLPVMCLSLKELLGINDEELKQVLTFNLSSARGEAFQRNYTKHQAQGKMTYCLSLPVD